MKSSLKPGIFQPPTFKSHGKSDNCEVLNNVHMSMALPPGG